MKRAAIIGLGDISQIHIAGILANPEITLCGLCDIKGFRKVSLSLQITKKW